MKDQFVDYRTAMKLREINFDQSSFGYYYKYQSKEDGEIKYEQDSSARNILFHNLKTHCVAPLWQEVEDWLWMVHEMMVITEMRKEYLAVHVWSGRTRDKIIIMGNAYYDPLVARNEGIKNAIEHLHRETAVEAVTPNNQYKK